MHPLTQRDLSPHPILSDCENVTVVILRNRVMDENVTAEGGQRRHRTLRPVYR